MDEQTRFLIIGIAIAIAVYFWLRGRSARSYLGDAEDAKSIGDPKGAAIALEQAAEKVRKTSPVKAAAHLEEAGGYWMEADRAAAAVNCYQAAESIGGETGELTEKLQAAQAMLDGGPADAQEQESKRRHTVKQLNLLRRIVLFGGVIAVYFAIQQFDISYWWLVVPLALHMVVYFFAEKQK